MILLTFLPDPFFCSSRSIATNKSWIGAMAPKKQKHAIDGVLNVIMGNMISVPHDHIEHAMMTIKLTTMRRLRH